MKCPFCKRSETKVLESRQSEGSLRRRRECLKCTKRFTTYERMETTNLLIIKRSGDRQQFNRDKLRRGLLHSTEKRPISSEQIEGMLDEIEEELKRGRATEVPSKRIGDLVMKKLKRLDKIAYIRFAAVYLDFKDPEDFEIALKELLAKGKK